MTRYMVGDVFDRMREIADGTVSLVASSPPFIALRSYLPADHPDKGKEIGSEPNPAAFLDTLLALTAVWGDKLAPWGSIAIELGDTYSGSGGAGGDYGPEGMCGTQPKFKGSALADRKNKVLNADGQRMQQGSGWPAAKCLALIPQAYALSLAYGRNVLTGQESPAGQWLVRNMIVWHRPNPAVGALGDKVRPSTSYITVATRSKTRWFDLTAVRTPLSAARRADTSDVQLEPNKQRDSTNFNTLGKYDPAQSAGAPPLDCWFDQHDTWTVTTSPSKLAHYAMWPPKLAERLILMMCPEWVCSVCGEPRRRIERALNGGPMGDHESHRGKNYPNPRSEVDRQARIEQIGWTDCGCDYMDALRQGLTPRADQKWIAGTVLDPFAGTFTTGLVAEYHNRDSIGIDIDARNELLIPARREEVRRALNPTHIRAIDGQGDLFEAVS